ncbi:hypothetical protein FA15DRAFT_653985 [Coprinopsis marcescibilis]|uniref:Uncharacterized protein n=1 Tax=Coprinopsis marcescibilis TaxID=230819 RepID=A0A5C3L308_COPMA|nr:hypothetical protein FA15DRAFT_653985 [Coprinopsis marcescibilis]
MAGVDQDIGNLALIMAELARSSYMVATKWKGRFNLGKFLFFTSRYLTFFDMALYGRNLHQPDDFNECGGVRSCISCISVRAVGREEEARRLTFCHLRCYCILLVGELLLTVTALTLGFRKYRESNSSLAQTLYRDGSLYYLTLLSITALNVITPFAFDVISSLRPLYTGLFSSLQRVMRPILANQVLLGVRDRPAEPTIIMSGLRWEEKELSSMTGFTTLNTSEESTIDHQLNCHSFSKIDQV